MLVIGMWGVVAGVVTTVAGMGGGQLMLLGIAWVLSPAQALALTAPALLFGNLHRLGMLRAHVHLATTKAVVMGAVPGALLGGMVAVAMPGWLLRGLMVAMACLALAKVVFGLKWSPPARWTIPVGGVGGLLSATGGGAGVFLGPFLLARGLSGATYVATMASIAVCIHAARLFSYGVTGLSGGRELLGGVALAVAVTAGNLIGRRLRTYLGPVGQARVQVGAVLGCLALALAAA